MDELTPQEIKELISDGTLGSPESIAKLSPKERAIYDRMTAPPTMGETVKNGLLSTLTSAPIQNQLMQAGIVAGSALPLASGIIPESLAIPGAGLIKGAMSHPIGVVAASELARRAGVPGWMADLLLLGGMSKSSYLKTGAAEAEAEATPMGRVGSREFPIDPSKVLKSGETGRSVLRRSPRPAPSAAAEVSPGIPANPEPGGPASVFGKIPLGSNVSRGVTDQDMLEMVGKGVQNDFRGPVVLRTPQSIERSVLGESAIPYNISSEVTPEDIYDLVTGDLSHGRGTGEGTPVIFQDKATRNSVDRLKRAVRRQPK